MAHERVRHVTESFLKASAHSPLVGILGHRQVGKTTFLSQVSKRYLTLDDPQILAHARLNPTDFVSEYSGSGSTAIDECQLAPELFPALKEWVRTHKRPGQFLMSGSVRFTSRSAIRESLTGRIMNIEILPFGVAELAGLPLPGFILKLARSQNLKAVESLSLTSLQQSDRSKIIDLYLEAGGLPGVCFLRDPRVRSKRVEEQLYTILDRDLRSVHPIKLPYRQILEFLMELAKVEGEPINHTLLKSRTGISPLTQKKILYALEAVFIVRTYQIQGARTKWTYQFEDQAEWKWLIREGGALESDAEVQKMQWNGAVYRNLRLQSAYRFGEQASFFGFQTRSGVCIPIAINTSAGVLGINPILSDEVSHKALMGAHSFLANYTNSTFLFVSRSAKKIKLLGDRIALIPASLALFE